jgi:diguanylate cyclase (GGDEF)-like protein
MRSSRSADERGRLLDLNRRLRPLQHAAMALAFAAGLVGVPTFGWLWLVPPAIAAAVFSSVQARLERFQRPARALLAAWLFGQVMLVAGFALASGPRAVLLPGMVLPAMIAGVAFPSRAVALGTGISALLMVAAALGFAGDDVLATPPLLLCPLVVLIATSLLATAVRDSDIESRGAAVVDRLTGALNRLALGARVAELAHQSSSTAIPVAAIVGDLDHFKAVNDSRGHAAGDAVLRQVARRMRECLGAFDPVYRLGGEEFAVLLAGADANAAAAVAERLRRAVRAQRVDGVAVTISLGVAASRAGERFDHELVIGRADDALYEAKRRGRDRVCVAPDTPAAAAAETRRRHDEPVHAPAGEPVSTARGENRSWLIRDPLEREHLLDMHVRNDRVGHIANALAFGTLAACVPWFGVLPLVTPLVGAVCLQVVELRLRRFRRPEYALGAAWLVASLANATGFVLAPAVALCALPMFVLMIPGFGALFPTRGLAVGVAAQVLIMTVAGFAIGAEEILADPVLLALPLALLGGVALTAGGVAQSAFHHRGAAIVDGLTGILNRAALERRSAELAHESPTVDQQVALVIGDVDRFKAINDAEGHAGGDAALREIAGRLRTHLRAFEPVYRFGGEEFVVLLAGVDADAAAAVAERLRLAMCAGPIGGRTVTMSFGVAATAPGERFDFHALFGRADAALYEAKRSGRDRVVTAAPGGSARAA